MSILNTIGTRVGRILGLPGLRLRADAAKCESCGSCTRACSMSLKVTEMVKNETMDHPDCILCGECASVCRSGAVVRHFGRVVAGGTKKRTSRSETKDV
ncbi:4Fe-4S dicluster domain-containing protein [Paenibacillus sp. URB8-2]|uniref:4Fe-4S dicluster domain-containing protein n=1 Tax=Paenibacillus sp. URB8-2 TaxID=2741301 RepID=UPI0015BB2D6E